MARFLLTNCLLTSSHASGGSSFINDWQTRINFCSLLTRNLFQIDCCNNLSEQIPSRIQKALRKIITTDKVIIITISV